MITVLYSFKQILYISPSLIMGVTSFFFISTLHFSNFLLFISLMFLSSFLPCSSLNFSHVLLFIFPTSFSLFLPCSLHFSHVLLFISDMEKGNLPLHNICYNFACNVANSRSLQCFHQISICSVQTIAKLSICSSVTKLSVQDSNHDSPQSFFVHEEPSKAPFSFQYTILLPCCLRPHVHFYIALKISSEVECLHLITLPQ